MNNRRSLLVFIGVPLLVSFSAAFASSQENRSLLPTGIIDSSHASFEVGDSQAIEPVGGVFRRGGQRSVDAMWNYAIERPQYRILPRVDHHGKSVPASPKPVMIGRPIQPYAYGWFGVPSTPTWYRHYSSPRAFARRSLR
jgi:hypothetical protein